MKISVVIPVYNCEKWLDQCVHSALIHDIVTEVVIVDDGSTDNSLKIASRISSEDNRIRILTHDNNANLGRSVSRNLAWRAAQFEWIAFLDADDYYLPNRFDEIRLNENLDGWYGSIETRYESPGLADVFEERITKIDSQPEPEELLDYLIQNTDERFSLNALIIKKSCLENIGGFDPELKTGEDTDLIWRLADKFILKKMLQTEPLAVRRIHSGNSFFQKNVSNQKYLFYKKWKDEIRNTRASDKSKRKILRSYLHYHTESMYQNLPLLRSAIKGFLFLRHYANVLFK